MQGVMSIVSARAMIADGKHGARPIKVAAAEVVAVEVAVEKRRTMNKLIGTTRDWRMHEMTRMSLPLGGAMAIMHNDESPPTVLAAQAMDPASSVIDMLNPPPRRF